MKNIGLVFLMIGSVSLSGCLKTRAELREEHKDGTATAGTPAQVKDVEPQGVYALDEVKGEMTRLNGRIEDLERSAKDSHGNQPSKEDLKKLETRITELEQAQASMLEAIKKMQD